jgi:hypothetical protein
MGPVLPVSLLVRPLLPHLSKVLVTVHPVALMAANFKDNFGGKNSTLFLAGRLWRRGLPSYYTWQAWVGPVLPVSLLVRQLLLHLSTTGN